MAAAAAAAGGGVGSGYSQSAHTCPPTALQQHLIEGGSGRCKCKQQDDEKGCDERGCVDREVTRVCVSRGYVLRGYLRFGLDVLALGDVTIGCLLVEPASTVRARDERGVGRGGHGRRQRRARLQGLGDVARGLHGLAEHLALLLPFRRGVGVGSRGEAWAADPSAAWCARGVSQPAVGTGAAPARGLDGGGGSGCLPRPLRPGRS